MVKMGPAADGWMSGRVDSNADLLLGEQHDPEAESKLAAEEDKHSETGAALICPSSLLFPADVFIYSLLFVFAAAPEPMSPPL